MKGAGTQDATRDNAVAQTWLELDARARVVLDTAGHRIWSNTYADALLAEGHGISLRDGALHFATPQAQRDFDLFLTRLSTTTAAIILEPHPGEGALVIRGWRVADDPEGQAWIEITRDDVGRPLQYVDFERVFRLTPAEHRAALALLDGKSAAEIATAHAVSLETVRTQIKSVYAKVGVSHRDGFHSRMRHYLLH